MNINQVQNLKNQAISSILEAKSDKELEELRISYLGRKGKLTQILKELSSLPAEERVEIGKTANDAKGAIQEAIKDQQAGLREQPKLEKEWLDVTAPGKRPAQGHLHLITHTIREITKIFEKIGFTRVRYPEVEWDWYSFEALNMKPDHPARDMFETFYVDSLPSPKYGKMLLTPHTSSGQIREMKRIKKPPIRMLNVAKCYRPNYDASHAPMFYQFETLVIDKGINITHLKGTLDYFAKQYFGPGRKTRIRPFHFQFTEPSFEVDVTCIVCGGKGCKVCGDGWLELGGSGMVHPTVLQNGGIDPREYTGFASGWGVERILMMKYGIPDIRLLFGGDLRFLEQF